MIQYQCPMCMEIVGQSHPCRRFGGADIILFDDYVADSVRVYGSIREVDTKL